jgi:hypothetical protein
MPPWSAAAATCARTNLYKSFRAGRRKAAVLFERDCGATTAFTSQVSFVAAHDGATGSGHAFIADDDHGAAPSANWAGAPVSMRWTSPTHLIIGYDFRTRVFKREGQVDGVEISYVPNGKPG